MSELKGIDVSTLEPCEYRLGLGGWHSGYYVGRYGEDGCYCVYDEDSSYCYVDEVRPIQEKKTRPMTAQEIALLPRGTAFIVKDSHKVIYSPEIIDIEMLIIGEYYLEHLLGYRLPNETDTREFEVECE